MRDLRRYSALSTKLRAMQSRLIPDTAFREMTSCKSTADIIRLLSLYPDYRTIFEGLSPEQLHREALEQLLLTEQYADFSRLYRFAGVAQRKCLKLELLRFETVLLKRCLRSLFGHLPPLDLSHFRAFFLKHGHVDFSAVTAAKTLRELAELLRPTRFAPLFTELSARPALTLFDCETGLDLWYFRTLARAAEQQPCASDTKLLRSFIGTQADLLNLRWIRRARLYYQMSPDEIRAILIPLRGKLKRDETERFLTAESEEAFMALLGSSAYGPAAARLSSPPDIEQLYTAVLDRLYTHSARQHPYSCAVLVRYLRSREAEIRRIISVTEAVRYGLPPEEIVSEILKLDHRRSLT